ncbi:DUF6675 family protein [Reyranella sp.]|uniref:DUF6675 family protein n=1 Tax=Reyranella sp. TaxID=1929291 RepID=UPI002F95B727
MRRLVSLSLAFALVVGAGAAAAAGPRPPCGVWPEPSFPAADNPPAPRLWHESELRQANWSPAPCLGWEGGTRLAGAIAGTFTFAGSMERLIERIGAFSRYRFIPYWSGTADDWRPLVREAGLVGSDGAASADADLAAGDIVPGRVYDYFQVDAAGRTTYRLTVRARTADRLVLATENTSAIRLALLPLFDPGSLQSVMFLERAGRGLWHWYQAMRAGEGASLLALGNAQAYGNRLAAFYRYVARGTPSREEATQR